MSDQTVIRIETARPYDIVIGKGLFVNGGSLVSSLSFSRKICVVTDENVAKLYLLPFMKMLEAQGLNACPPIILPPGEESKSFDRFHYVIDRALGYKLDRQSALVALGGGVIGDITGFAASVLLRGVPYVQAPTTLLAQVDSSVGGKTGINTSHGKNLVGSFYQPALVLMDTDVLKTLPRREYLSGYAEVLKYALIDDPDFFQWLEKNGKAVLAGDEDALRHAVAASCRAKARIVAADEKETKDVRALLNLGHTFAHAIEALCGYDGRILHGEAVGVGLSLAFGLSAELGLCSAQEAENVRRHLSDNGLMQKPPIHLAPQDMVEKMRGDKKNVNGQMTLILAKGIGQAFVCRDVDEKKILEFLQSEWRRS